MQKIKLAIGNIGVRVIKFIARKAKLDLIRIGYSENGITKSYSLEASGELYFISTFLKEHVASTNPVFFDVGGNKGDYSALLKQHHANSEIHAFEPNPNTYQLIQERLGDTVTVNNLGVGAENGSLNLYFDANNTTSVQATSDPEILKVIAKTTEVTSEKIVVTTLDAYCAAAGITTIDLLKIDTEGFELEALQGASQLLKAKAIKIIQFEFNEVNIVKRRFLKDFYDLLEDFDFYRLDEKELIPLKDWQPIHEIFMFQNIIAICK